jgi:ArsR family transcriptional regulator
VVHAQEKLDLEGMQVAAGRACSLLKTLGNADRLLLLCQLTQGEFCVSELESMLGIQQPTLSQQLGVLREEKLVNTRREGKQIYYSLASKEATEVMQVLYRLYCVTPQGENNGN